MSSSSRPNSPVKRSSNNDKPSKDAKDVCQGYLDKRGEVNRSWKTRWCRLEGSTLFYYKTRDASKPIAGIKLEQAVVRQARDERSKPFGFEIVTKQRAYQLAANSREDMERWITQLAARTILQSENQLIERAEKLIRRAMREQRAAILNTVQQNKQSMMSTTDENAVTDSKASTSSTTAVDETRETTRSAAESVLARVDETASVQSTTIDDVDDVDDDDNAVKLAAEDAKLSVISTPSKEAAQSKPKTAAPSIDAKRSWAIEAIRAGSFQVGRDMLLELLRERPKDAAILYHLACAESLMRNKEQAFRYLQLALRHGHMNIDRILRDPDLHNVRSLPEFAPMIKQFQSALHVFDLMRQPRKGVDVRSRKWRLKSYPNCFVGKEAVDWLLERGLADTRESATSIGQELLSRGLIRHVVDEHDFEDSNLFYRFVQPLNVYADVNDDHEHESNDRDIEDDHDSDDDADNIVLKLI